MLLNMTETNDNIYACRIVMFIKKFCFLILEHGSVSSHVGGSATDAEESSCILDLQSDHGIYHDHDTQVAQRFNIESIPMIPDLREQGNHVLGLA